MKRKKGFLILIIVEIVALICILAGSIFVFSNKKSNNKKEYVLQTEPETVAEPEPEDPDAVYSEKRMEFPDRIERKLSEMTLEEKVAQLFVVTPDSLIGEEGVKEANDKLLAALDQYPVGGLTFTSENFGDQTATRTMMADLQSASRERDGFAFFLMASEEGGNDYSPLAVTNGYDVMKGAAELGTSTDAAQAKREAEKISRYLKEEGLDTNLAPMADLAVGNGKQLDARCFNMDAELTAKMVAAQVEAYTASDVMCVLKYFPGMNGTIKDTATNIYIDHTKMEDWENGLKKVYVSGIEAGAKCIMVGNAAFVDIVGDMTTPCSVSPYTVAYLRKTMNYKGLIMAGPFSDDAIKTTYSAGDAAVAAVSSGFNLIYMPADFNEAYTAVIAAVKNGEISESMLDNSVGRILMVKYQREPEEETEDEAENQDEGEQQPVQQEDAGGSNNRTDSDHGTVNTPVQQPDQNQNTTPPVQQTDAPVQQPDSPVQQPDSPEPTPDPEPEPEPEPIPEPEPEPIPEPEPEPVG